MIVHHSDEQVRDTRCSHIAHGRQLTTIDPVKEHYASAEHLTLVHRLKRSRSNDVIRMQHHLYVTRFEFLHAAFQNDPSVIDEDEVGQHVLHFFNLMRCYDDRARLVEIIVEQRVVELFAIQNVETKRGLDILYRKQFYDSLLNDY